MADMQHLPSFSDIQRPNINIKYLAKPLKEGFSEIKHQQSRSPNPHRGNTINDLHLPMLFLHMITGEQRMPKLQKELHDEMDHLDGNSQDTMNKQGTKE